MGAIYGRIHRPCLGDKVWADLRAAAQRASRPPSLKNWAVTSQLCPVAKGGPKKGGAQVYFGGKVKV